MNQKILADFYKKYRLIIWPVVSSLSSLLILGLVIIPQLMSYLDVRQQIGQMRDRYSNLEVKAQSLEKIDQEAAQKNLQTVLTVLPTSQDVPGAATELQRLVLKSGTALKDMSYAGGGAGDQNSFILNIDVVGQIGSIRNLLISLQDSSRIFQVQAINVHFQPNSSIVNAQIPLEVYYSNPEAQKTEADQPVSILSDQEEVLLSRLDNIVSSVSDIGNTSDPDVSDVQLGKSDPFQ